MCLDIRHSCTQKFASVRNGKLYSSKAEWKYEIQCPLLFKLDPARCYLRRHMKARDFEIARQFIDLYYLTSLEKEIGNNLYRCVFPFCYKADQFY